MNDAKPNVNGPDYSHNPRFCVCKPCHRKLMSKPSRSIQSWGAEWAKLAQVNS